ncbi:uncharacterized protein LOC120568494, partial [Perca fluviatilis]|uniref:uncharacterized protein LOC120568494 n=1 Tax=Perca fluviatilis TaxID=8168 RepID=UPI001963E044
HVNHLSIVQQEITELSLPLGVSCEELTPVQKEENSLEGSSVTLSCRYSKGSADYFFWYRQYSGKPPEFLISHLESGEIMQNTTSGLSVSIMNNSPPTDCRGGFITENCLIPAVNIRPNNSQNFFILNLQKQHFTSADMETLTVILFCFTLIGNTMEDDITASSAEMFSSEGRSVTLSCTYSVKADNLQWYRQDPGSATKFLLLITDTKTTFSKGCKTPQPRLKAKLNDERNEIDLQISSAEVTDSAVYYCA